MNYRDIAHKYFPNALCCADSFHVIKYINDALDKIRCKVMNRYKNNKNSDEYLSLKYSFPLSLFLLNYFILYKRERKLSC